jgi:hypothetical protein
MPRSTSDLPREPRPLWEPWFAWPQLPEDVRQHALDVLTALYLETVHPQNLELKTDDQSAPH